MFVFVAGMWIGAVINAMLWRETRLFSFGMALGGTFLAVFLKFTESAA